MSKKSAGILAWRKRQNNIEVLLVHPGGPFFAKKDTGAWSIPKGEFEDNEEPLAAARREFKEELGIAISGVFMPLSVVKQKGGKTVLAWAVETDVDVIQVRSNTFLLEWPPRSGKAKEFAEIDRAEWFDLKEATVRINPAQTALLNELNLLVSGK